MKHGSGHAVLNAVEDRFVGQQIECFPSRESRFGEHGGVVVRLAAAAELAYAPGPDPEDAAGVADGFLTRRVINDCPCDLEALVRKPQRTGPRATCKLLAVGQQHVRQGHLVGVAPGNVARHPNVIADIDDIGCPAKPRQPGDRPRLHLPDLARRVPQPQPDMGIAPEDLRYRALQLYDVVHVEEHVVRRPVMGKCRSGEHGDGQYEGHALHVAFLLGSAGTNVAAHLPCF